MKLISLIACLDYPCTINFNVLNEDFKDIPISFKRHINFPRKYYKASDLINAYVDYLNCYVVLFEEISINREYRIDVY